MFSINNLKILKISTLFFTFTVFACCSYKNTIQNDNDLYSIPENRTDFCVDDAVEGR